MDTNQGSARLHNNNSDIPPLEADYSQSFGWLSRVRICQQPRPLDKISGVHTSKMCHITVEWQWSHRRGGCQVSDNCSSLRYNISKCEVTLFLRRPQNNNILQLMWRLII